MFACTYTYIPRRLDGEREAVEPDVDAGWQAVDCRVIVASVNRFLAYLLAFLMALMPSVALACNAAAMLASSGPMQTMGSETATASDAGDCCHEQTATESTDMSANGSACSAAAMCAFAAAAAASVTASPATFAAPVSSSAFDSSDSDHFLSADKVPDLRPPIA